jgi:hypothetical protein
VAQTIHNAALVLEGAMTLGRSSNVLDALLGHAAVLAVQRTAKENLAQVRVDFASLRHELAEASDMAQLSKKLLEPLAQKYELDALVSRELAAKRITVVPDGLIETAAVNRITVVESCVQRIASHFQKDVEGATSECIRTALGLPDVPVGALGEVLGKALPQELSGIVSAWASGKVDLQELVKAKDYLVGKAGGELGEALVKLPEYAESFEQLVDGLKVGPDTGSLSETLRDARARAQGVSALLSVFGANKEAEAVSNATKYVEAACQTYQVITVLAAGATGWGAAVALMGLANGGMSLTGTSAKPKEDGTAVILQAIAKLTEHIDKQFEKVNATLSSIAGDVKQIYATLQENLAVTKDVQTRVKNLEKSVAYLLERGELEYRVLADLVSGIEKSRCRMWLLPDAGAPDTGELNVCIGYYGTEIAGRLGTEPYMHDIGHADDPEAEAAARLNRHFDSTSLPKDTWYSASSLWYLLEKKYAQALPAPVHWPALAVAAETSAQLRLHANQSWLLNSMAAQQKLLEPFWSALEAHNNFVDTLRGPSGITSARGDGTPEQPGHPLLKPLLQRLDAEVEAFVQVFNNLVSVAQSDILAAFEEGTLDIAGVKATRIEPPLLRNPATGTTWEAFGAGYRANWTPPHLLSVYVPLQDEAPASNPLTVDIQSLTRTRANDNQYVDTAWGKMVCQLYGESLAEVDFRGILRFDYGRYDNSETEFGKNTTPADPVAYITRANGKTVPSGAALFSVALKNKWDEPDIFQKRGRELQAERILVNKKMLWAYIAERLTQPKERQPLLDSMLAIREVGLVIRAICRFGWPEAYNTSDVLPALFEGELDSRLPDGEEFLAKYVEAVQRLFVPNKVLEEKNSTPGQRLAFGTAANVPARERLRMLSDVAKQRVKALETALDCILTASNHWGAPFDDQRVQRLFDNTFRDVPKPT